MGEKKFAGALALVMIVFAVIMEIYSYKVIPDIEVGVSSFNDNWTINGASGKTSGAGGTGTGTGKQNTG